VCRVSLPFRFVVTEEEDRFHLDALAALAVAAVAAGGADDQEGLALAAAGSVGGHDG